MYSLRTLRLSPLFKVLTILWIVHIFLLEQSLHSQNLRLDNAQNSQNFSNTKKNIETKTQTDAFHQNASQKKSRVAVQKGIGVRLRANKPIYFVGEKMLMNVEIFNDSPSKTTYRFVAHDNFFRQIKFFCVDKDGHAVFPTIAYESWKYVQNHLDPNDLDAKQGVVADLLALQGAKQVELAYGQSFKMTVDLNDYFHFDKEGKYFVSLQFLPAPLQQSNYFFTSEQDQINVRLGGAQTLLRDAANSYTPSFLGGVKNARTKNARTNSHAKKSEMDDRFSRFSPNFVVEEHLKNQQKKDWVRFLSAIQLDEFLTNSYLSTDYYERFRAAKDFEMPIIMDDFSRFLVDSIDYRILRFEPIKTLIVGDEAKVEVAVESEEAYNGERSFFNTETSQEEKSWQETRGESLTRSRVFIYTLRRIKNVWKIVALDTRIGLTAASKEQKPAKSFQTAQRVGFVYFDFNRFDLRAQYKPVLQRVVEVIANYPDTKLLLVGYADDLGTDDYNLNLSTNRVESVFQFLTINGVAPERIVKDVFGEVKLEGEYPVEELRQQNRRVELSIFR